MNNKLIQITDTIPAIIKNTHLTINLQGWPAAVTAITLFGSCIAIYALKITHNDSNDSISEDYVPQKAS